MNDVITKLLHDVVKIYRDVPYKDLTQWVEEGRVEVKELKDMQGFEYTIELQAFWDNKEKRTIRFMGAIDRSFTTPKWKFWRGDITESFIKSPDDSFVDE